MIEENVFTLETLQQRVIEDGLWVWIFALVFTVVAINFGIRWLLTFLEKQIAKTENFWDDALVLALKQPLSWMVWIVGISTASEIIYLQTEAPAFEFTESIRTVLVLSVLIWFVTNFIREAEKGIIAAHQDDQPSDDSSIRAIARLLRTAVFITGVLMILQSLGFNISGVLAFGSIGGLAVSFAAKDLLANFFGGLMVYLDRPFAPGDWVRSPDRQIEGTVEAIGWRTTRIRTFDQRPLYVPNSAFTTISVENPSRMLNRRIYETIGVRYDDVSVMQPIVDDVRKMLSEHQDIDPNRTLIVNFDGFVESSLEFFIYTFTKTTVWVDYHHVKQDVLLRIADIVNSHGADMAFPTRTVIMAPPSSETSVEPEPVLAGEQAK